jgi:hypothetical protein
MTRTVGGCYERHTYLVLASLKVAVTRNVSVENPRPELDPTLKDLKPSL